MMALLLKENGCIEAIDNEQDEKDHAFRKEMQQLNMELGLAQCDFDAAENDKEIHSAEKKLQTLERKLETVEQRYQEFQDKYQEKQSRWQDKMYEKYGDSGPYKE